MADMTASDVALLANNHDDGWGNSGFMWIFALLILAGGGFGGFGNNKSTVPQDVATVSTVQDGFNFSALERQNNETISAISAALHDAVTAVKDGNYNLLGEIRDLQQAANTGFSATQQSLTTGFASTQQSISDGFANMQKCCCETLRAIDGVNYNGALNKADIVAAIHAEGETTRNMFQTNRMADMQNQINQLQLMNAVAGVVRYPNASTYYAGANPYCPGCSSTNI